MIDRVKISLSSIVCSPNKIWLQLFVITTNQVEYIGSPKIVGAGAPPLEIRVVSDPLETRVSPACVTMPNLIALTIYMATDWP